MSIFTDERLAAYEKEIIPAFADYFQNNAAHWRNLPEEVVREQIRAQVHGVGYAVADADGDLRDAQRLAPLIWNEVIKHLIFANVPHGIKDVRTLTKWLQEGYDAYLRPIKAVA